MDNKLTGRPKKACPLTDEEFLYILSMYEEGASDAEVRAYLYKRLGSFSSDLWDRWIDEEEIFSATIKKGKELSKAWWLKKGRELENGKMNSTLWYMNMKNRFGWRDKVDMVHDGETTLNIIVKNFKDE